MKEQSMSMVFDTQLRKALQSWSDSTWKVISGEDMSIEYSGMASPYLSHCYMEYRPGTGHVDFVMLENERFYGVIHKHPVEPNVTGNFLAGIVPVRCVAHLIPWQFPRFFERGQQFCHVSLFNQFGGFDEEGEPVEREQGFLFINEAIVHARGRFNTSPFFEDGFTWNRMYPKKIYQRYDDDDDGDDTDRKTITFLPCSIRGADFGLYKDRKFTMTACFKVFGNYMYHQHLHKTLKDASFSIDGFRREWFAFLRECIPPHLELVYCGGDTYMITDPGSVEAPAPERVLIEGNHGPEVKI